MKAPSPRGLGPGCLALSLLAVACAPADDSDAMADVDATAAATPPDTVRIASPGLHPEGIEYDAERGRFLVTSVTRGEVTAVHDDGSHQTLVADPDVHSAIGIHLDPTRDRMYIASSDVQAIGDQNQTGRARLAAYDLDTGAAAFVADLAPLHDGRHFANDMTVGPDGMVYVTDSLSPVIYRVTPDGEATVFLTDEKLGSGFVLNGIDLHPDGYLLVAGVAQRTILRVPLDAPDQWTAVELAEPIGADGLTLHPDGTLIAVATTFAGQEPAREVLVLASDDGWTTARVVRRASAPEDATTAVVRDGHIYVVDARFARMADEEPAPTFDLIRIEVP